MKNLIILFFICTTALFYTQESYVVDNNLYNEYPFIHETNRVIQQLKNDPVLRNANWGFSLYDPITEKEIISKDAYKNYIPASTTKLVSSESALRLLGEDFTWKTQIAYTGYIEYDGTLQGNLYFLWNGDPTIGLTAINAQTHTQIYQQALQRIKEIGVKKINGKIIFESVVFNSEKSLYPFDDRMIEFNKYYSLIPNENQELTQEEISFNEEAKQRTEQEAEIEPEDEEMSVEDLIMKEIIAEIELNNKLNQIEAIGVKNLSLAAPPAYWTKLFHSYLQKNGISVAGGYVQQNYLDLEIGKPRTIIVNYKSPPLKDLIYYVNQKSNNVYAEHLIRTIGVFIGKRDTQYNSLQTITKKLEEVNFYYNGFNFTDGSGLS